MKILAANRLHEHDLSRTAQRQMIYAHLLGRSDHPNADMVYQALKPNNPHLSKMTVYKVLSALVEHHLCERVHIEDDEMRFDADMSFHAHFRCRVCEKIFNIFPESRHIQSYVKMPDGFKVEDEQVIYYGVCAKCAGEEEKNAAEQEKPAAAEEDKPAAEETEE